MVAGECSAHGISQLVKFHVITGTGSQIEKGRPPLSLAVTLVFSSELHCADPTSFIMQTNRSQEGATEQSQTRAITVDGVVHSTEGLSGSGIELLEALKRHDLDGQARAIGESQCYIPSALSNNNMLSTSNG